MMLVSKNHIKRVFSYLLLQPEKYYKNIKKQEQPLYEGCSCYFFNLMLSTVQVRFFS